MSSNALNGSALNHRKHRISPEQTQSRASFGADGFAHPFSRLVLRNRVWLLGLGHCLIFIVAYWVAFGLRFDFEIPPHYQARMAASLPVLLSIKLAVFYLMGHFHGWWRYVTFADFRALMKASMLSLLILALVNQYALDSQIPRSVVFTDCLVAALLLSSARASWRLWKENGLINGRDRHLALMVGADHANGLIAHQIHSHPELPYRIVGFLDDNDARHGTRLGDIPVLGFVGEVLDFASSCKATHVLVTADTLSGPRLRQLMDDCERGELFVKVVPSVASQLNGNTLVPVRDVEINDLLRRDPVNLDMEAISREIEDRTVLVTGAGGSIGSEIGRQLLLFGPRRLVLVDHGENSLFLIQNELAQIAGDTEIVPAVADILDRPRMRQLFAEFRPDYVFHAAAHKHVGIMESNIGECVKNNVFGTKSVADLAEEFDAEKFVLISTDKAVNPTSVMGATKQIAERYIHALGQNSKHAFVVVRFGNVLGSNGSVVPLFREQIRRGGPITITDTRMTRFFMTIPEASQLVLQSAVMGKGGEIFVLEMGNQIRIVDLARDLIRLSGLPTDAIDIDIIGIRPGEKLYEELYNNEEKSLKTAHPKVQAAHHRPYQVAEVRQALAELESHLERNNEDLRQKLKEIVPEYVPLGHLGACCPRPQPETPQPENGHPVEKAMTKHVPR